MASPAAILAVLVRTEGATVAIRQLRAIEVATQSTSASMGKLTAASNAAAASQGRLAAAATKGRAGLAAAARPAGYVALAIGAIGAAATKSAAEYQTSMNTLQAVSEATDGQMRKLSKRAIQLGADTKLPGTSAQDAAGAMLQLVKSGVSVDDTLSGVRSTLVLSAAANIDNAQAAQIAANAMKIFGLRGKDVEGVVDQLANVANQSSLEIVDVAAAMKMAGSVFNQFQAPVLGAKGAMTELSVAIGLLGNAGIRGQDAGTSLKQALLQLTAPSDKSKDAMAGLYAAALKTAGSQEALTKIMRGGAKGRGEALEQMRKLNPEFAKGGDIAYTAAGKMRSLKDIIKLVAQGTKGMTQEQKNWYVSQIFGADATRAVGVLLQAQGGQWDTMAKKVTKAGEAQDILNAKMKGLQGRLDALKSALQTLGIQIGTYLLPPLTAAVGAIAKFVSAIDPKVFTIAAGAILVLTASVWALNAALAADPIILIGLALIALGAGLVTAYQKVEAFRNVVDTVFAALKSAVPTIIAVASAIGGALATAFQTAARAMSTGFSAVVTAVRTAVGAVAGAFNAVVGAVRTAVNATVTEIGKWKVAFWVITAAANVLKAVIGPAFAAMATAVRVAMAIIVPLVKAQMGAIVNAVKLGMDLVAITFRTAWNVVKALFSGTFTALKGIVLGFGQTLHGVIEIIGGILKGDFGQIWEGVKDVFRGQLRAVLSIFKGFTQGFRGAAVAIGAGVIDAFTAAFEAVKKTVTGFINAIINIINKIPGVHIGRVGGGGGGGGATPGQNLGANPGRLARGGAFGKTGGRGVVNKPIVLMGEEAPSHPEFVIPTNPAYRKRAQSLVGQAAGAVGLKKGGVITDVGDALSGTAGKILDGGASFLTSQLPKNSIPQPFSGLGSYLLAKAGAVIKDKVAGFIRGVIGGDVDLPEGFHGGSRVVRMIVEGNRINSLGSPYVYGGYSDAGYDCSGLVSKILNAGGFGVGRLTTDGLKVFGEGGDGRVVTIGVRGSTGRQAHAMMKVGSRYIESGGTAGGAKWVSGWDGSFPIHRHPEGFAKGGVFAAEAIKKKIAEQQKQRKGGEENPFDPKVVGWGLRKGGVLSRSSFAPPGRPGRDVRARVAENVPPATARAFVDRVWGGVSSWLRGPEPTIRFDDLGRNGLPYTTSDNVVHWNVNDNLALLDRAASPASNWAKTALVHEMAHAKQRPWLPRWAAEGGAQQFAQYVSPRVYGPLGYRYRHPSNTNYAGFVERVYRLGRPFWLTDQFSWGNADRAKKLTGVTARGAGAGDAAPARRYAARRSGSSSNLRRIAAFLKARGFSNAQVAGILGNLRQESNFSPNAVERPGDPSSGHGIAQWTGGRATALRAFAQKMRRPWNDLGVQLAFMMHEFQTSERDAFAAVRGSRTVDAAETAFGKGFERYGVMGDRSGGQYLSLVRSIRAGAAGAGGGRTREDIQRQIDKNQDRLDRLRQQVAHLGAGRKTRPERLKLQDQIRNILARNRHLRSQMRGLPKAGSTAEKPPSEFEQAQAAAALRAAETMQRLGVTDLSVDAFTGPDGTYNAGAAKQAAAMLKPQQKAIAKRINKIQHDLQTKKHMRASTRVRLQQELAGLIPQYQQIAQQRRDLVAGPQSESEPITQEDIINQHLAQATLTPGSEDDQAAAAEMLDYRKGIYLKALQGGDPRQIAQAATDLKSAMDANTEAHQDEVEALKAHAEALKAVADELKRQSDFAAAVTTTEAFQMKKIFADLVGSGLGALVTQRSFGPGYGNVASY